jgi:hypothetical protein
VGGEGRREKEERKERGKEGLFFVLFFLSKNFTTAGEETVWLEEEAFSFSFFVVTGEQKKGEKRTTKREGEGEGGGEKEERTTQRVDGGEEVIHR